MTSAWRREPFRLFFPLGVVLGWLGVGPWLLYVAGVTKTISCVFHGLVQVEAFLMAFAVGFLLTAIPRRTATAPPSTLELALAALALVTTALAATVERWALADLAYGGLFLLLLQFAGRRFLARGAGRRPPAAFVLIPLGALHGLAGAGLIVSSAAAQAAPWTMSLGRLFVEQGVFLCFAVGVGSLVLPLMAGLPPPPDLGTSRVETAKALAYAALGLAVAASLVLEHAGWVRAGPCLRAVVVAAGFAAGGAWRAPRTPGLHRRLVWIAVWMMPLGLTLSGLWPDYRVPALHILFIGGFSLLVFGVATHVALAHLGLEALARGRPPAVMALGVAFGIALLARFAADWSDTYFEHLGWAAASWLAGSAAWLAFLGGRLLRTAPPSG